MVPVQEIRELGVFCDLPEAHLQKLSGVTHRKSYPSGSKIYLSKERARRIFIVREGLVSLRSFEPGDEIALNFGLRAKGELFGGASFLKPQKHTVTAICLKDTELLVIEAPSLWELIDEDALFGYRLMKEVAQIYFDRYVNAESHLHRVVRSPTIITALPG